MLTVFNIQRYSIHDGEGIRTIIFFKGCPLRCQWCNNPESQDPLPSIMYDKRLCHGFGDCALAGNGAIIMKDGRPVIRRELISDPLPFNDVCPSKALVVTGENKKPAELISEISKDDPFFTTCSGGVTLSGGEPFMQGPELRKLVKGLKQREINLAIETSLHTEWEKIKPYTDTTDMFLADLKHTDEAKFREFTGGEIQLVMENFRNLDRSGAVYTIRIPVIPSFNHTETEMREIISFAGTLQNAREVHLIPFNNFGAEKYRMLGRDYSYSNRRRLVGTDLEPYVEMALKEGITAKIVL